MNKTELIADIAAKGLRVIATQQQSDPVKEAAGVNSYITNVLEQNGDRVTARNIGWYVMDEGLPEEVAWYRDQPNPKNEARDAIEAHLDGIADIIRYRLETVNEEEQYAFATVWKDNGDTTATESRVFIWKDEAQPIKVR